VPPPPPARARPPPAPGAPPEAGGTTNPDGGKVVVVVPGSGSGGWGETGYKPGGGANSNIDCGFFAATTPKGAVLPGIGSRILDTSTLNPGDSVWLLCRDLNTGQITFENFFTWDPANPPLATPSAAVLAQMASNTMHLPLPAAQTWPSANARGLVNLAVWLHVDNWKPVSASASAGGLTATVEATPVRAKWDMGENQVTCSDAGKQFTSGASRESSCSYTYQHSSGSQPDAVFHDSVVVVWHLRWSATNGQGGDLGEVSSRPAAFTLAIDESQALVAPGGH
jgi:hypothetical protein